MGVVKLTCFHVCPSLQVESCLLIDAYAGIVKLLSIA
jgi:hypothetical protein